MSTISPTTFAKHNYFCPQNREVLASITSPHLSFHHLISSPFITTSRRQLPWTRPCQTFFVQLNRAINGSGAQRAKNPRASTSSSTTTPPCPLCPTLPLRAHRHASTTPLPRSHLSLSRSTLQRAWHTVRSLPPSIDTVMNSARLCVSSSLAPRRLLTTHLGTIDSTSWSLMNAAIQATIVLRRAAH